MRSILTIAQYASAISGIIAAVVMLVKPVREKVTGTTDAEHLTAREMIGYEPQELLMGGNLFSPPEPEESTNSEE